jgi:acyl-coenzyme A synthetase/AMP-(fatty) acid ligase
MTPPETPPHPESTYRLLLDAAGAWPDGIATRWIPDPADHTRCLDWTYAELASTATRIANALTALGVRRADAVTLSSVNTSMLYAATLAAQAVGIAAPVNPALSSERIAELVRRTGLLAWAGTAIGEAAARPKRIYPIDAIPLTSVGKQFKPALAADAAVRVVTEAQHQGPEGFGVAGVSPADVGRTIVTIRQAMAFTGFRTGWRASPLLRVRGM